MPAPACRRCLFLVLSVIASLGARPLAAANHPEPALQTRPWRIAVGGAWATGYMGLLARHGMPRERLLDTQLADVSVLKRYDIVIVTDARRARTGPAISQALEQYVREGGIGIIEPTAMLPQNALRAVRVAIGKNAGLVFVDSRHPISKELVSRGTIPTRGWSVVALLPQDEPDVRILARFIGGSIRVPRTRDRGRSLSDAPAVLLKPLGKGQLLYVGIGVSRMLALRGPILEDFILAALRYFSEGQLVPRFAAAGSRAAVTAPARAGRQPRPDAPAPPGGEQEPVPGGFELIQSELPVAEFNLTATVRHGSEAEVLFDYWNARWHRSLWIGDGEVELRKIADGQSRSVRRGLLPADEPEPDLLIKRRSGRLIVVVGPHAVLTAADGLPWQGAVACRNLNNAELTPVVPVYFTDDFTRREGDSGGWDTTAGSWKVDSTEGSPHRGANPFSYQFSTASRAIATTGHWFWDDYAFGAAAKWTGGPAGLCFHYDDPRNYLLLEVRPSGPGGAGGTASIVRVKDNARETLAQRPLQCQRDQWYRLGVCVSGGWISGMLDGRIVVEADDVVRGQGRVGLYADGARGHFDDVAVTPYRAIVQRAAADLLDDLEVVSGKWSGGEEPVLQGRGKRKAPARAISGRRDWDRVSCSARVRPRGGDAGFCLRCEDEGNYYLLLVRGARKGVVRLVRVADGRPKVIAQKRHQGDDDGWWDLRAELRGPRITGLADGEPVIDVVEAPGWPGGVGLCVRGQKAAEFSNLRIVPLNQELQIADPPTPDFAGIVDRHTWAGTAGAWLPQPAAVGRFWHNASFPGDVRLNVGIHREEAAKVCARAILGDGSHSHAGYTLEAAHTWGSGRVGLLLYRDGESIATGAATIERSARAFLLQLERAGDGIIGRVNGEPLIAYNDPQPLQGNDRLGLETTGTRLCPDDIAVESAHVRTHIFADAPVDWLVESGTWEIARRWDCQKEWTWFAGWSDEMATIRNKHRFAGDLYVDVYVGPKMMASDSPDLPARPLANAALAPLVVRSRRYREELSDIFIRICRRADGPDSGYIFVIASQEHPGAALTKDGRVVAEAPEFRIPQAGIHNDWVDLAVKKSGDIVGLYCFGQPVIEYTDPTPLPAGYVSIGTYHNAILIPRITIYAREEREEPADEAAARGQRAT